MIDFYFLIHYVIYRHYRQKGADQLDSLVYACSIQGALLLSLVMQTVTLPWLLLYCTFPVFFSKSYLIIYTIVFCFLEYFLFYRKNIVERRYIEVFAEYDQSSNTHKMKNKLRYAKIFNYSVLIFDIASAFACRFFEI